MKRFIGLGAFPAAIVVTLAITTVAYSQSSEELKKFSGVVVGPDNGINSLFLEGKAPHIGRFVALGEVEFVPGEIEGSLVGQGVAVFVAADGDLLVGVVAWEMGAEVDGVAISHFQFHWRDSVEFSDGTTVSTTGRFVDNKPAGLVVISQTTLELIVQRILRTLTPGPLPPKK